MPVRRSSVLMATVLGSGVVFLDGTVVNVALETIGEDLPASIVARLEGLTYVTTGYLAVLAALLILAGAFGDRYGRRRVFGIGLVGFAITSVACGLAPTLELLVLARLAQGAAGALLVPGALALITACLEGEARGRAIGIWAAATSAVVLVAPVVGGVLVQGLSWRAVFLINIPLVVVALVALRDVPESRDETATGDFDWLGAAIGVLAVGGLAFGVTRGKQQAWQDPIAWAALLLGAVCLVAFPVLMARRPHPLVPLHMFRSRSFRVINLSTFLIYGSLYVSLTFQLLFLRGTLGYTPLGAGLATMPSVLLLTVLSTYVGRASARHGPWRFLVAGPSIMAIGLLWLVRIPATSQPWVASLSEPATLLPTTDYVVDVLPAIVVYGLGLSLMVAPLTTALMASIPLSNVSLGSAINNAVSRVGTPLVAAVLFIVISATFYSSLAVLVPGLDVDDPAVQAAVQPLTEPAGDVPPEVAVAATQASTSAFHLAMLASAGLLGLGALTNGIGLAREPAALAPGDMP